MALTDLTALQALAELRKGSVSSEELTRAYLERIERLDKGLVQAYVTVTPELALEQARAADARRRAGEDAPLLGLPMALKDLVLTRGVRTTCSSKMLENFVPIRTPRSRGSCSRPAPCCSARRTWTSSRWARPPRTPPSSRPATRGRPGPRAGRIERRLGGGGRGRSWRSFAIGSDTGGSIRQPASLCGVVGMKPTYGRVSRFGLVAFASSLDQLGPFTADVADCALVTEVIAGHDPLDSTSLDEPVPRLPGRATGDLRGVRARRAEASTSSTAWSRASSAVDRRRPSTRLRGLGAEIGEVSLPHTDYGAGGLLHHRASRVQRQPGPLRRRQVRLLRAGRRDDVGRLLEDSRARASATRSSAASCSAPTRSAPATTTPTT